MDDLRKAAQNLLDDWDNPNKYVRQDRYEALRAALAQPEQLVVGGDDLPTLTKWTPMAEYAAKSAAVPGRAEALKQAGYTRRPRQLPGEDEQGGWELPHRREIPREALKQPEQQLTLTFDAFVKQIRDKAIYETIYADTEGRDILVITLLDAYVLMRQTDSPQRKPHGIGENK